jgi:WhiB family redox-sensing transcriptional regulator
MRFGLCAQTDPEAFFPDKGERTRPAKAVCEGCPVRDECLNYALEHNERFGVWGGKSERERRVLRRDAAVAAAAAAVDRWVA